MVCVSVDADEIVTKTLRTLVSCKAVENPATAVAPPIVVDVDRPASPDCLAVIKTAPAVEPETVPRPHTKVILEQSSIE